MTENLVSYHTLIENSVPVAITIPFLIEFAGELSESDIYVGKVINTKEEIEDASMSINLPDKIVDWLEENNISYTLPIWGDDVFSKEKPTRYISGILFENKGDMLQFQMRWLTKW